MKYEQDIKNYFDQHWFEMMKDIARICSINSELLAWIDDDTAICTSAKVAAQLWIGQLEELCDAGHCAFFAKFG